MKRKLATTNGQEVTITAQKVLKPNEEADMEVTEVIPAVTVGDAILLVDGPEPINEPIALDNVPEAATIPAALSTENTEISPSTIEVVDGKNEPKIGSPMRRGSQESSATTATTTTTTGSDSTSSSSSDSSGSDTSSSDSESDSSEDSPDKAMKPLKEHELESIFKTCIRNLEECVTRFPEHYKSIYRLVNIYLNAPDSVKDLRKCKQLLLSTYTTGLNNPIQGLFADRKNNNFFNVRYIF